jgi:hypothetical protein
MATNDPDETRLNVNESADKIVLKTAVKRGGGTRDEDKLRVKIKGNNPRETAARLAETLDALREERVPTELREQRAYIDDNTTADE